MRIDQSPTRIEGFCNIPGWPQEQQEHSVIIFSKVQSGWILSYSMSFLSDLDQAMAMKECFDTAFELVKKLTIAESKK